MLDSIVCADCFDLMATLEDASIDMIFCDPPYGVGKVSAWRPADMRFTEIANNDKILKNWIGEAYRVLKNDTALYVCCNWQNFGDWKALFQGAGFAVRGCIVWDKLAHGMADLTTCFAPRHEFILFAAKGRHELRGTRPKDVIRFSRIPPEQLIHPYEKPVELIEHFLHISSLPGDVVLDPFAGSGTTALACMKTGRHYICGDSDPDYVTIAQRRVQTADPYTNTPVSETEVQLSLFEELK